MSLPTTSGEEPGRERTGYPTQKPAGIVRRIVQASSRPGDTVLDFFAGSGTLGAVARELGRRFILVDNSPDALAVMAERFADMHDVAFEGYDHTQHLPTKSQGSLFGPAERDEALAGQT